MAPRLLKISMAALLTTLAWGLQLSHLKVKEHFHTKLNSVPTHVSCEEMWEITQDAFSLAISKSPRAFQSVVSQAYMSFLQPERPSSDMTLQDVCGAKPANPTFMIPLAHAAAQVPQLAGIITKYQSNPEVASEMLRNFVKKAQAAGMDAVQKWGKENGEKFRNACCTTNGAPANSGARAGGSTSAAAAAGANTAAAAAGANTAAAAGANTAAAGANTAGAAGANTAAAGANTAAAGASGGCC